MRLRRNALLRLGLGFLVIAGVPVGGVPLGGAFVGRAPDAAADDAGVPLDKFFKGAVIGLDGNKVKLRYDFATAEQAADWPEGVGFNLVHEAGDSATVADGKIVVHGSTGVHHVGEWEGDLSITAKLIPDGIQDIGSWLGSNEQSDDCVTYTIAEKYFHAWDSKPGGDTGMMKFGKQYATSTKAGFLGFRYLAFRRPVTDPVPGKPVTWGFGRNGEKLFLSMDKMNLESVEPPNHLKTMTLGFYTVKSSMAVDDVVIEGTLSSKFVEKKKLALRTEKPIVAEAPTGVDAVIQTEIDAYKKSGKPDALVKILGDAAQSDANRTAVAAALKAGPHRALPAVIDVLYSADLKARQWGIEVVKAMTGKNYGYGPSASEKARQQAIRRLNEDLTAHPDLLQGGGG